MLYGLIQFSSGDLICVVFPTGLGMPTPSVLQTHLKLHRRVHHGAFGGEGFLKGSCRVNGDVGDVTGFEVRIPFSKYDGPVTIGRSHDIEGPEFLWTKTLAGRSSDWTVEIGQGQGGEQQLIIEVETRRALN